MAEKHKLNTLIDDLKERGLRVTPQRAIILEAIESLPGHVTAEEIFAVVNEINAYVSLATVYRTLEMLRDLDLITESHMGTATTHYALRTHATHHHAICRNCRGSIELPKDFFQPLDQQFDQQFGFKADTNHLVIFGWCQVCRDS